MSKTKRRWSISLAKIKNRPLNECKGLILDLIFKQNMIFPELEPKMSFVPELIYYIPLTLNEINLLSLTEASRGDIIIASKSDKRFHYMFKTRGKQLFIHRTNQRTQKHIDIKTIFLKKLESREIDKHLDKMYSFTESGKKIIEESLNKNQ